MEQSCFLVHFGTKISARHHFFLLSEEEIRQMHHWSGAGTGVPANPQSRGAELGAGISLTGPVFKGGISQKCRLQLSSSTPSAERERDGSDSTFYSGASASRAEYITRVLPASGCAPEPGRERGGNGSETSVVGLIPAFLPGEALPKRDGSGVLKYTAKSKRKQKEVENRSQSYGGTAGVN